MGGHPGHQVFSPAGGAEAVAATGQAEAGAGGGEAYVADTIVGIWLFIIRDTGCVPGISVKAGRQSRQTIASCTGFCPTEGCKRWVDRALGERIAINYNTADIF